MMPTKFKPLEFDINKMKFRVFIEKENKYFNVKNINLENKTIITNEDKEYKFDEVWLSFFTGYIDTSGKEIFTDDIIARKKDKTFGGDYEFLFSCVEYSAFYNDIQGFTYGLYAYNFPNIIEDTCKFYFESETYVVGNRKEHPYLLEGNIIQAKSIAEVRKKIANKDNIDWYYIGYYKPNLEKNDDVEITKQKKK